MKCSWSTGSSLYFLLGFEIHAKIYSLILLFEYSASILFLQRHYEFVEFKEHQLPEDIQHLGRL